MLNSTQVKLLREWNGEVNLMTNFKLQRYCKNDLNKKKEKSNDLVEKKKNDNFCVEMDVKD